ncbi:ABC transporter permease [Sphingomonas elodea]|uniref:ABC transporter permease n=1 Tax=Sphingomonas elodea TaxID=179878 RepID=UPI0002630D14|nr:ABC transporter permease [Sphingomonas elodea]
MSTAALAPAGQFFSPIEPEEDVVLAAPAQVHRRIRRRPALVLAAAWLVLLVLFALVPDAFTRLDPLAADAGQAFLAPAADHWLGTDENGRDLLSRMIHGTGISLVVGLAATLIGLAIGSAIGLLAALGGRIADHLTGRLLDALMAFPDQLLALVIITFFGQGTTNLILAIAFAMVPRNARLVRAQALLVRRSGYVEAAQTLGLSRFAILWRHILPNALKPLLIILPLSVGNSIAASAGLSFLGFGAPPPAPEWGAILAVGRNYLPEAWWLVAAPALAITLTVLAITVIGRTLRARSEGRAW